MPEVPPSATNRLAARYLLGLGVPVRVWAPDDVREALLRQATELLEING